MKILVCFGGCVLSLAAVLFGLIGAWMLAVPGLRAEGGIYLGPPVLGIALVLGFLAWLASRWFDRLN